MHTYKKPRGGRVLPIPDSSPAWRQPVSITYALPIFQPLCFDGLPPNVRGVLPWRSYFLAAPLAPTARNPVRPHPRFVPSLHLCFITSFSPVQSLHFHPGEK